MIFAIDKNLIQLKSNLTLALLVCTIQRLLVTSVWCCSKFTLSGPLKTLNKLHTTLFSIISLFSSVGRHIIWRRMRSWSVAPYWPLTPDYECDESQPRLFTSQPLKFFQSASSTSHSLAETKSILRFAVNATLTTDPVSNVLSGNLWNCPQYWNWSHWRTNHWSEHWTFWPPRPPSNSPDDKTEQSFSVEWVEFLQLLVSFGVIFSRCKKNFSGIFFRSFSVSLPSAVVK